MGKKLKRKRKGRFHKGGAFRLWMIKKGFWKRYIKNVEESNLYGFQTLMKNVKSCDYIAGGLYWTDSIEGHLFWSALDVVWRDYCKRKGIK